MYGSHNMRNTGFCRLTVVNETPGWGVIVGLFHRRFFHGQTVVNDRRVPLDMTDSKRKRKQSKCLLKCDIYTTVLHIVFGNIVFL